MNHARARARKIEREMLRGPRRTDRRVVGMLVIASHDVHCSSCGYAVCAGDRCPSARGPHMPLLVENLAEDRRQLQQDRGERRAVEGAPGWWTDRPIGFTWRAGTGETYVATYAGFDSRQQAEAFVRKHEVAAINGGTGLCGPECGRRCTLDCPTLKRAEVEGDLAPGWTAHALDVWHHTSNAAVWSRPDGHWNWVGAIATDRTVRDTIGS